MTVTKQEVEQLIEEIKDWGCSCDLMLGYGCGHTKIEYKIKDLFEKAGVSFES